MTAARPFVKWAGGKRRLLPAILEHLPAAIDTYVEPFVGGGAVFFALAAEPRRRWRRAVLGDRNTELLNAYVMIRDHVDAVIAHLRYVEGSATSEAHYLAVRAQSPRHLSRIERAARVLYLNRTAFNGLWRENRRGEFSTAWGRYERPIICDERNLYAVAEALQGVELVAGDFAALARRARRGDAVYFDPPYVPTASTSFVAYQGGGFGAQDHRRVAREYRACLERGAAAVLSNSLAAAPLYEGLACRHILAPRRIASRADRRDPVLELLVVGRADSAGAHGEERAPEGRHDRRDTEPGERDEGSDDRCDT